MVTDVTVVYNDDTVLKRLGGTYTLKVSPFFHFIDERTAKGKKDAFKLKGHWSARQTPFAVVYEKDNPVKVFYSEAEDVIESLIKYLNDDSICS